MNFIGVSPVRAARGQQGWDRGESRVGGNASSEFAIEDVGGSGEKQETYSGLKIDVAKKVLTKAIRNLPDNAQFEVILFNHQFKTVFGAMTLASIENKNKAEKALVSFKPQDNNTLAIQSFDSVKTNSCEVF